MWRVLELAILAWIVLSWLGRLLRSASHLSRSGAAGPFSSPSAPPEPSLPMVRCATCGTHVPVGRTVAIGADGRAFCSEACRPRAAG